MAYEPTVWKTGDIVSSERLNKMENGISNQQLAIHILDQVGTGVWNIDVDFSTIADFIENNGYNVVVLFENNVNYGLVYQLGRVNWFNGKVSDAHFFNVRSQGTDTQLSELICSMDNDGVASITTRTI